MKPTYHLPPHLTSHAGKERKVGFELEFSGLGLKEVAATVAEIFSGEINKTSDFEIEVNTSNTGSFTIELDWQLGKKIARQRTIERRPDHGEDTVTKSLSWLAGQVVPIEVVCPPIPISTLDQLDPLVEALRQRGAKGTEESLFYAFGVHINPEIPDSSPWAIARYLQAFAMTQEWLFTANNVDIARKISPYIDTYPNEYITRIVRYDESITQREIIADYMKFNNSRNRALDMLPLWLYLDEQHMATFLQQDDLTQKRPTFHYRLPNCAIDREGWYLNRSWNIWCVVEHLAEDHHALRTMLDDWELERKKLFSLHKTKWQKKIEHYSTSLSLE